MDFMEQDKSQHAITYNFIEVTDNFKNAVSDLQLGELLNDQMFGLFEAMSAIEMMDPKMDAGMLCNRGVKKILTFETAVKEGVLKLNDFTPGEIIAIIDMTLACIVTWLEGHSMAQTVFINLYLHHPYEIEDKTLRGFCLMIYKLIEVIKDFIHKAIVYEEEDFQPMQYGYGLKPDISDQRITAMLREIEEELHRKARTKDPEVNALYARIKFMRVFYNALLMLHKNNEQQSILDCQRLLSTSLEMLATMKTTIDLGVPLESEETFFGFEPLVNQRLLPPTFPRYTKIKSRKEAINYLESIVERFKTVCKIHNINSFHNALEFFIEFSKSSPCILSRSALQLLYPGTNSNLCKDILREAVKNFIQPPALVSKSIMSNQQAKHNMDAFLSRCSRPFASLLQLCGHNRARQRDKLANLLEEFVAMQDEAERIDAYLHNLTVKSAICRPHLACFGTWILYHTLKIMIMYLLAGFELELYSPHEFYYIYWYLYEFLFGWLVSALSRADSFLVENELLNELPKTKSSKKKPKNKNKKPRPYSRDIFYYQALQNMCGGYYKALMGFRLDKKIASPHQEFDNEQVRYEHRFAPFQNLLTPPPVQYTEFRDMTSIKRFQQQPVDSSYLYLAGCKHFHQARQLLETIPQDHDVTDLLKIVKTNFIVLKLLAGGHKKDCNDPVEFDFSLHKHFAIIKIK